MTNILITGITGFIGSHLAQHLSENKNNNIYGLFRSLKDELLFKTLHLTERRNINLILGDILYTNIQDILVQYDIDTVYHLAAKVIVKDSAKSPLSTYQTNINGTINILESIRLAKETYGKIINCYIMSSDKAYGSSNMLPYKEDYPLNGLDIYSSSKACEDIIARSYAFNYDLPIVVGRPCNCYGLDFNWSRLIPTLAKSCFDKNETDKPLYLNKGSYNQIREYIYVKDLVQIIELLIKYIYITKGEAYNITNIHNKASTKDIVKLFLRLSENENKEIIFKEKQITFKEINEQSLDLSKLHTITEFKPKYNFNEGLIETINLYKKWFDQ